MKGKNIIYGYLKDEKKSNFQGFILSNINQLKHQHYDIKHVSVLKV